MDGGLPMLATFLKRLVDNQSGATAIEYGLIVSLIVIAITAAMNGFAASTIGMWTNVSDRVDAVTSG